ncbi:hypothetical protein N5094_01225 [Shewanella putrefaciens]|uniref:DUF6985 domain-containing protein n=1 Tax=Shewanella putrefaciens TaxID=24 RepID=UPI0021BF5F5A|nr:hypothetical protein [Shewanella putrefaciens]UXK08899.1 hypothetical protein N5094_01225 [Shewanella putrefaciens]
MNDPLLNKPSELIIEGELQCNDKLRIKMLEDVSLMTQETKHKILNAMLKMHKYFEDYCGDLEISLNTINEIAANTQPLYIILDDTSTMETRAIRYHYTCNWETDHGVEVLILNGNQVIFVGNCGYTYGVLLSSIDSDLCLQNEDLNFLIA